MRDIAVSIQSNILRALIIVLYVTQNISIQSNTTAVSENVIYGNTDVSIQSNILRALIIVLYVTQYISIQSNTTAESENVTYGNSDVSILRAIIIVLYVTQYISIQSNIAVVCENVRYGILLRMMDSYHYITIIIFPLSIIIYLSLYIYHLSRNPVANDKYL